MINFHATTLSGSFSSLLSINQLLETDCSEICVINPTMIGAISDYSAVKAKGKKFIMGLEVNVAYGDVGSLRLQYGKPYSRYVLIAKNRKGYENLVALSSFSYKEGMYQVPRIDFKTMSKHKEGIICLFNIYSSVYLHYTHGSNLFNKDLNELIGIYGDDLYYEYLSNVYAGGDFSTQIPNIKKVYSRLVMYKDREDYEAFRNLYAVNHAVGINEVPYDNNFFYSEHEEFDNPDMIFGLCDLISKIQDYELEKSGVVMPDVGVSDDEFVHSLYLALIDKGLVTAQYKERLEYELSVIIRYGYKDYFLIVSGIIKYCNDELEGYYSAGRGSVGGCLVAYLLGITRIDPVNPRGFGMSIPFDRFLNSGRKGMPDIDMDFLPQDRDKIIKYLQSKYGENSVKHMTTVVTFGARSSLREVCRINGCLDGSMDSILKLFPAEQQLDLKTVKESEIYQSNIGNSVFVKMFELAEKLEGKPRSLGIHASGIALSSKNMDKTVPFLVHNSGKEATQYSQEDLDFMGVVKLDVLGVNVLQIMKDTLRIINPDFSNEQNIEFLNSFDIEDRRVYEFINNGDITGVFQWDTHSYKSVLKLIKPNTFQQLVDINTLGRSAALLSGLTQRYADRKEGKEAIEPLHEKLRGMFDNTFDLPLYQEQIMMVFVKLAGYSLAEADDVRKAMGKKIPQLLEDQKKIFAERCKKAGMEDKDITEIWEIIDKFSKYTWNFGHAVAYTKICYETAFLACHYPLQFYCSFINNLVAGDNIGHYLNALKRRGLKVESVDINRSQDRFVVDGDKILSGFNGIKYVGEKTVQKIIEIQENDGYQWLTTIPKKELNIRAIKSLLASGAFDKYLISEEDIAKFCGVFKLKQDEYNEVIIDQYKFCGRVNRIPYELIEGKYDIVKDLNTQKSVKVLAYVVEFKEIFTKNKNKMAFATIETEQGQHEVVIFPSVWEKSGSTVQKGSLHCLGMIYDKGLVCNFISRYVYDSEDKKEI